MKKSSRKRLLVSSVAMLLVAMIALGTATFAWFTNNRTVTADGMKVKAVAAKGFEITKDNGKNWGNNVTFAAPQANLLPASLSFPHDADSNAWSAATVAFAPTNVNDTTNQGGAYIKKGSTITFSDWYNSNDDAALAVPVPVTTTGVEAVKTSGYFVAYRVGIRTSQADSTISNVKFRLRYTPTAGSPDAADYMRVAIVRENEIGEEVLDNDKVRAVYGNANTVAEDEDNFPNPNAVVSVDETTKVPTVEQQYLLPLEQNSTHFTSVTGTVGHDSPVYYTILVWFEGQDKDCINDNQTAEGSLSLTFSYDD